MFPKRAPACYTRTPPSFGCVIGFACTYLFILLKLSMVFLLYLAPVTRHPSQLEVDPAEKHIWTSTTNKASVNRWVRSCCRCRGRVWQRRKCSLYYGRDTCGSSSRIMSVFPRFSSADSTGRHSSRLGGPGVFDPRWLGPQNLPLSLRSTICYFAVPTRFVSVSWSVW